MAIQIQELLLTLLNDMSQSKELQQSTMEMLAFKKSVIADEHATVQLRNQKFKIIYFLEAIFEAFQKEDTSNLTKAAELSQNYSLVGDDLLNALADAQFQEQFLDLFTTEIVIDSNKKKFIFPSIVAYPINREKLQLLLHFCVTNKNNLQEESLSIVVPKEEPVIIPKRKPSTVTIQFQNKGQDSSKVENYDGMKDYEDELKKRETNPDSTDDDADLQTQEKSDTCFFPPVSMIVLGGFIAAIGIAGIALALTLLVAAPHVVLAAVVFGAVVAIGGIAISGVGFFRHRQQNQPLDSREMIEIPDDSEYNDSEDDPSFSGSI